MSSDRISILQALEAANGEFVSGSRLGQELNVSRTTVWKQVKALRRQGYVVESASRKGHRLVSSPATLSATGLSKRLLGKTIGSEIRLLPAAASTQDECFKAAQKGAPEGLVVLALEQTGGRGRVGRTFFSPKGGLWLSVILRPRVQPQISMPVSLMAGVALSQSVRSFTGLPAVLKWPNDLLVNGKKVAGILTEIVAETDAIRFVICGIGVNANIPRGQFPGALRDKATSLSAELGHDVSLPGLACAILEQLDHYYRRLVERGAGHILAAWRDSPNMLGARVRASFPGETVEGIASGLDESGALIVKTEDGLSRRVIVGDVELNAHAA